MGTRFVLDRLSCATPLPAALYLSETLVPPLTAREVYQQFRDVAQGIRTLTRLDEQAVAGQVQVDIEGWHLTLEVEAHQLRHCLHCLSSDGRTLAGWQRYGTDPVSLLSTWELAQIERRLAEPQCA